ncbi:hypothetical protein FACS189496_3450 [Bacilli bacterium]|nr:hypothetical protein FACS189496_3450 [Bacilli bacterium]
MSNKIDYNLINSINKKADIVNIISKYIKLDKKGTSYVGICPFHPDTSPSLSVNPKLNFFKCFVCGTKGGPIEFVEKYCKIPFLDAVKIVAEASGTDITAFLNNSNNIYFNENIKRIIDANKHVNCIYQNLIYENKEAQDYLEKRKLDKSIVERFEIGYAPSDKKFIYYICTNHDDMFGKERSSDLL